MCILLYQGRTLLMLILPLLLPLAPHPLYTSLDDIRPFDVIIVSYAFVVPAETIIVFIIQYSFSHSVYDAVLVLFVTLLR